jgi:catechol 2,3-dioxygenase-like lactoylglutathione lyase family enzyme
MAVRRIVANIAAQDTAAARAFYGEIFDLDLVMDHGWIATYGASSQMNAQISIATEGGSGTPVPDISIEVDDLAAVLERLKQRNTAIAYGPVDEPWGVRRFFVRDPFGKLLNVLSHI